MIADLIAQSRKQAHASVDEDRPLAAVVSKLERRLCHAYVFLQPSCPSSSRRRCTPTTSRRYQALAIASVAGEVPSAAAATAAEAPAPQPWLEWLSAPSRRKRCAGPKRVRRPPRGTQRSTARKLPSAWRAPPCGS